MTWLLSIIQIYRRLLLLCQYLTIYYLNVLQKNRWEKTLKPQLKIAPIIAKDKTEIIITKESECSLFIACKKVVRYVDQSKRKYGSKKWKIPKLDKELY